MANGECERLAGRAGIGMGGDDLGDRHRGLLAGANGGISRRFRNVLERKLPLL
jgi:hypothetical protein